jgi:hypothetical protein
MRPRSSYEKYEQIGEFTSIFQRGGRWYVHYRNDGKPIRQSLKTTSKKQARSQALRIERDLLAGESHWPTKAPHIKDVIDEYLAHLVALGRSQRTVTKYQFCFNLVLKLAKKRGICRIDQIDESFIDAYRTERHKHAVLREEIKHGES